MATTAEQMQAAIDSMNAVASAFHGKNQAIDEKVNALIPTVSASLVKTLYVDPVNGDDNNAGNGASPMRTLAGCAAVMSAAGAYIIYLRGDVVVDSRIGLKGSSIFIASDTLNTKRRIDFANQIDGVATISPSLRINNGFAGVSFRDIIFGNVASAPHIIDKRMIEGNSFTAINTWICEWDTQAGDDFAFVSTNSQVALWILSGVVPPEQAGLWLDGAPAGTDPSTVPRVLNTNLTAL